MSSTRAAARSFAKMRRQTVGTVADRRHLADAGPGPTCCRQRVEGACVMCSLVPSLLRSEVNGEEAINITVRALVTSVHPIWTDRVSGPRGGQCTRARHDFRPT